MFNRLRDEARQLVRTGACTRGEHAKCPHLLGIGPAFNLGRLRPEIGIGLCLCDCHAACPVTRDKQLVAVTATVPVQTWRASCTCPGADTEQARWNEDGPGAALDEDRQRQQARREALAAAKEQAPGKSRDEIKEIYAAEIRARGQETPSPEALDVIVDLVQGDPFPGIRRMGDGVSSLVRFFRNMRPDQ